MKGFVSIPIIILITVLTLGTTSVVVFNNKPKAHIGKFSLSPALTQSPVISPTLTPTQAPKNPNPTKITPQTTPTIQPEPTLPVSTPTQIPTQTIVPTPTTIQQPNFTIESITPNTAKFEDEFTIKGLKFGSTQGMVVFFTQEGTTGAGGPIVSWSDNEIKSKVPFMRGKTDYLVAVQLPNGLLSNKVSFSVTAGQPIVDSITPLNVAPGGQITIEGREFGDTDGYINYYLSGNNESSGGSVIYNWSDTKIVANIPGILAGGREYGFQVVTADGRHSSFKFYQVAP